MTNILANYNMVLITAVKRFIVDGLSSDVKSIFLFINVLASKLGRSFVTKYFILVNYLW